jgi:two-component system response regulator FlrC
MAPLSERREDIVPLANALIKKHGVARPLPVLRQEAKEKLLGHLWPGNVREMENVIQRALILAEGSEIRADDILFDDSALHTSGCQNTDMLQILKNDASSSDGETSALLDKTVKQSEHRVIAEILQQVNGNRRQAAASLGISERTLRYKLSKMRESGFELQAAM